MAMRRPRPEHLLILVLATAAAADQVELTLHHVASTMTSITVSWSDSLNETNVTTAPPIHRVEAHSLATDVLLVGPKLSPNETEYTLPDLAVDAAYNVCVISPGMKSGCAVLSTIPVVRDDSLIALLIAILVLAMIIIIAVILWRCAIRRAGSGDDSASDDKPEVDDDDKHGGLNEKSPLLVPTTAEPDPANPPTTDPAVTTQPDTANQDQPESLYLFLAGHAFK